MAQPYFKLDTRRPLKDGTFAIRISVGYGTNLLIGTGVSASKEEWNEEMQRCVGPDAMAKNQVLTTVLSKVVARVLDLRTEGIFSSLSNVQLKYFLEHGEMLPKEEKRPSKPSLGEMFQKVMDVKSAGNRRLFESTWRKLTAYTDVFQVQLDDINKLWLDGFCATIADLAVNTRSIHLRNIRTVINYAIDCGITTNYPFLRYRVPHARTRKRSFSVDTLRRIASVELPDWLAKYRDLFMLSFYLIGINVVDLCNLKDIKQGRIEYVRAKTHKPYSIKVEPEAMEIIERLRGEKHLLFMLDTNAHYRLFYNQWSLALRKIKDILGLPELSTYWSRHSWATIASSLDIPKDTIAHALGHGGNSVTDIYIDFDMNKVDVANRRVIDHVLYDK